MHTISIACYRGDRRRAHFDIEVSVDGHAWTSVVSNGRSSGRSLALEDYAFPASLARYVRIVGYGNSANAWNSLTEVAIHRVNDMS